MAIAQALLVIFFLCTAFCDDHGKDAFVYTSSDDFAIEVAETNHFVMFYAPWCGHCKRLAPTWNELAKIYNVEGTDCKIAKVDCTEQTALCGEYGVSSYPTLKFFEMEEEPERYKGKRDLDALKEFVEEKLTQGGEAEDKPEEKPAEKEPEPEAIKGPVVDLTAETFTKHVATGNHFVKFFAPWCGHCKRLAPTWEDLGAAFKDDDSVSIAKVDCTSDRSVCDQFEVRGYPTLLWIKDGQKVEKYQGGRTLEDLKQYGVKMSQAKMENAESTEGKVPDVLRDFEGGVIDLDAETFEEKTANGLFFIKFFAPWCGHCKRLAPIWDELGKKMADKEVSIAKVDCTKHNDLCKKFEVRGYPTLIMVKNGVKMDDYRGGRDINSLSIFAEKFLEIVKEDGAEDDTHDEL
ncbi:hypothetical protein ScPMuIL_009012 [Solemya velum]